MDEKINLLVCYFFNDTVYVNGLNPDPANAGPHAWLNVGPSGVTRRERQTQGVVKGEGKRSERTISQIIWKDYRGFSQITLSTEGETEIKRLEKGQHFSAVSHTIYLILMAACSLNLLLSVNPIKLWSSFPLQTISSTGGKLSRLCV